jgi:hypothetical protein
MSYVVFIPCAGTGSRLGKLTAELPKALVSVAGKPAVVRIFEMFPVDARFVVALGHQGALLREFLEFAYPARNIEFVEIPNFSGPGSGLGHTLALARHALQRPFVFCSCDTIVRTKPGEPTANWLAVADEPPGDAYRSVTRACNLNVAAIHDKRSAPNGALSYVGLAGIASWQAFWSAFDSSPHNVEDGEVAGLAGLVSLGLRTELVVWHDTGTPPRLEETRLAFAEESDARILEKEGEAIWFVGDTVIKYSADRAFIANRVARARSLWGFVPEILARSDHFYSYRKAPGRVFSRSADRESLLSLLDRVKEMWSVDDAALASVSGFRGRCLAFYRDKTLHRIAAFFADPRNPPDGPLWVNGTPTPPVGALLDEVPWDALALGVPCRFHGDFHFENILLDRASGTFTFLDWRQDFNGSLEVGDAYYDLAKLLHGLIVSHDIVLREEFFVEWSGELASYSVQRPDGYEELETVLDEWLERNNFSMRRVRLICALVFLNIATLHHQPYAQLLFLLGRSMLFETLRGRSDAY